jgi:hypothetical protein
VPAKPAEELLNRKEVAAILRCSRNTVTTRFRNNPRCIVDGNTVTTAERRKKTRLLIPQSEVDEWLRTHRVAYVRQLHLFKPTKKKRRGAR